MIKSLFKKISRPTRDTKSAPAPAPQPQPKPAQPAPQQKKKSPQKRSSHKQHHKTKQPPSWDISEFIVSPMEGKTRFHDLDLPDSVMHAINDLGFEYCTPIQAQILPHTLKGLDAIGKAQTGTGKTAAFLLTILDELLNNPIDDRRPKEPRALIVAPTRELVMQIADDAKSLCTHTPINIATLIGGANYEKQKIAVTQGTVDIVVATPGRLIDFMTRKDIFLDQVDFLVLDEADRMLDMGFIPQVKRIVRATPPKEDRQTMLFSATFDQDILNLSRQWTYEPVFVEIEPDHVATEQVEQIVYMVSKDEKFKVLKNILRSPETSLVILFVNRRDQAQYLFEKLQRSGINTCILTGDVQQNRRTRTLSDFKNGKYQVLVATDVMGRGIHVEGVTHVINYNLPDDPEDYVHRIGRTGRAEATGISISFACETEAFQLPAIEEMLGEKLPCKFPPDELLK